MRVLILCAIDVWFIAVGLMIESAYRFAFTRPYFTRKETIPHANAR